MAGRKLIRYNLPDLEASMGAISVLVVDDDLLTVELLASYLKARNIPVIVCQDGNEALDILRAGSEGIGLVLLDLAMPFISGLDVCRAIRSELDLPDLPVIAVTARVDPESLRNATDAGFTGVLSKPFNLAQLREVFATYYGY